MLEKKNNYLKNKFLSRELYKIFKTAMSKCFQFISGLEIGPVPLSETTNNLGRTSSVSLSLSFQTSVHAWQLLGRTSYIFGKNQSIFHPVARLEKWKFSPISSPAYIYITILLLFVSAFFLLFVIWINPYPAKLNNLNFQSHKVVAHYLDPQFQEAENYSYLFNLITNIYKYLYLNTHFILNNCDLISW